MTMPTSPELLLLEHAEFVRAADRDERELRQLTHKLNRLDDKVAQGHTNLRLFRDRLAAEIEKSAGRHHAAAQRRALIDRLGVDLDPAKAA